MTKKRNKSRRTDDDSPDMLEELEELADIVDKMAKSGKPWKYIDSYTTEAARKAIDKARRKND